MSKSILGTFWSELKRIVCRSTKRNGAPWLLQVRADVPGEARLRRASARAQGQEGEGGLDQRGGVVASR